MVRSLVLVPPIACVLWLGGCGRGVDSVSLFYQDPVVEAPTRSVDLLVVEGQSCNDVLSTPHEAVAAGAGVLAHRVGHYPLPPEEAELAELPLGKALALDVAAYDSNLLQVARGCTGILLNPDEPSVIPLELRALPACAEPAKKLDVMLVLDTSLPMEFADPDQLHIQALLSTVLDPVAVYPDTRWGLVTFGHGDTVEELVTSTTDLEQVRNAVSSLRDVSQGQTRLFDGLSKGTALLRARALCGYAPAMLALVSDADNGSARRFEDAQIGIFATPGDVTDDLFLFGIGLSEVAYNELNDLIPTGEIGRVIGANDRQVELRLREARDTISALVTR